MAVDAFTRQCVSDTLDGLRDGLSHFSGPSRTAVIFAIAPEESFHVCDPQNLLRGHEPRLTELFIDGSNRGTGESVERDKSKFSDMLPEKNLDLTGLISWGGRSSSVNHQTWFTEHHPDMCAIGPTERWLEHAAWRFSHDIANEMVLYTGISGSFLREYARHAVRDYIVDRMNVELGWDSQLRVYQILDAVLGISRTREERVMPDGKLVFAERRHLETIDFLARFPELEQPLLDNFKHVRKLLQAAEDSDRMLVSDGRHIVGICGHTQMPRFFLTADFKGSHGYLNVNDAAVCSFSDGNFLSTTRRANLVQLEEALLEFDLDPTAGSHLFKTVTTLVHHAEKSKIGCTLVIDLNLPQLPISAPTVNPRFDCAKASHEVEELICKDAGLASLDRKLTEVYDRAPKRVREDGYEDPRPFRRGWVKGRNDCWKAEDVRQCVETAYKHRIAELQIGYGSFQM